MKHVKSRIKLNNIFKIKKLLSKLNFASFDTIMSGIMLKTERIELL